MDRHDLNAALRRHGSNQAMVARRVGVTRQCVNNVLGGRRHNVSVERELGRVLGLPVTTVRAALRAHSRSAA